MTPTGAAWLNSPTPSYLPVEVVVSVFVLHQEGNGAFELGDFMRRNRIETPVTERTGRA